MRASLRPQGMGLSTRGVRDCLKVGRLIRGLCGCFTRMVDPVPQVKTVSTERNKAVTAIAGSSMEVPAHVPSKLVWDRDLSTFLAEGSDPFVAASRLHEGPGVIWARSAFLNQPMWIFTQHALIEEGFANYEKFSSKPDMFSSESGLKSISMNRKWLMLPPETDRPEHRHYRGAINPFFTPGTITRSLSTVQELCDSFVSKFIDRGSCEFISEFSQVFPSSYAISLLGLPNEMLPLFLEWGHQLFFAAEDHNARRAANTAVVEYLHKFIVEQKANPEKNTPIMGALLGSRIGDRNFSDDEVLGFYYTLYVAGIDTVSGMLGWTMNYLATDPELQDRLRSNPDQIPAAIEEFARAFAVAAPLRAVMEDMVFHGVQLKKGDPVLLPTYLAGRDPRAWENPHVIDIARRPHHVSFGRGPHVCIGVHLAKREIGIVLRTFLSQMKNIRKPEGGRYEFHTASLPGMDRLDLVWDLV